MQRPARRRFSEDGTTRPKSWSEVLEALYADSWNPALQRFRSPFAFRGLSRPNHSLSSSLVRLASGRMNVRGLEMALLRNFSKYAHSESERADSVWDWLALGQHRGLPTRLLDWTYSPLVAAFFATRPCDGDERTRVVWRLDWQQVHRVFRFPSLALSPRDLDALFEAGGHASPWQLFTRDRQSPPFACLVEPPSLDERIVAQAAVFTLCSDKWAAFDEFLRSHGLADALTKYVIPPKSVAKIRDQLDLVGVDERRLFPDLDGVAAAIRRYYA